MSVTAAGVGSGLDLESLITTYVSTEREAKDARFDEKEIEINTELSGVGTLKAALSTFESAVNMLNDSSIFEQNSADITYAADAQNPPISIGSASLVASGSFEVEVVQLAKGARMESTALGSASDVVGSGTMTFTAGSDSFDVVVGASDTLEDIRDKINAASDNIGMTANIINSDAGAVLVYNSKVTGDANQLAVTSSDPSLTSISGNMTTTSNAQNGIIKIDGQTINSETNYFTNGIGGLTIEALAETSGNTASLTISPDSDSVKDTLTEFVSSYNALVTTMASLSDAENGYLAFDSGIRSLMMKLSAATADPVSGANSGLSALYDLGISLDRDGMLNISTVGVNGLPSGEEKLNNAIENNLSSFGALFAGENGIANKMATQVGFYTESGGVLSEREKSLNLSLTDLTEQREALDRYIESYETGLRSKYTALDQIVAQYNSTSSYLTGLFASMDNNDN